MQPRKKIERFITDVNVATDAGRDRKVLNDVLQAHTDLKRRRSQGDNPRMWRTAMRYKPTRVAAVIALAVVLAGVFGLGIGSVAFSQVGHAVSSTLSRLRELVMEIRMGEPADRAPLPSAPASDAAEPAPDPNLRAVTCEARFFTIPANEQTVWQVLNDQGIELIRTSADPETYYATLRQGQAEQVEDALSVRALAAPRVTVAEGQQGMIATDVFALAWLPTISSDSKRIECTLSFHDGQNGFEIPNVSIEEGGVILVRVKGIAPTGEDILILLNVGYP
jgi:hypothetical protein